MVTKRGSNSLLLQPSYPNNIFLNGMATWPTDESIKTKTADKCGIDTGDKRRNYPYLEAGLIGAATLSKESLGWTFCSNPRPLEDGKFVWTTCIRFLMRYRFACTTPSLWKTFPDIRAHTRVSNET